MRRLFAFLLIFLLPLPALADGEARFAGVDGSLVHYRSWGKGDEAVVLIHGLTEDVGTWRHQIEALRKSYRVVALDLPGHGDSGKPKVAYDFDYFARAVLGVMDEAGVKRATLVGHSMGFPVSIAVLQKAPERVLRLVSVDGAIFVPFRDAADKATREAQRDAMLAGLKGPAGRETLRAFMTTMLTKAPAEVRKEVLGKADTAPLYMVTSVFENFGGSSVWAERQYAVPLLAIYARQSQIANPGIEPWLAARFPKQEVQIWRDVDHFMQLEQPARLSRAIGSFLRQP